MESTYSSSSSSSSATRYKRLYYCTVHYQKVTVKHELCTLCNIIVCFICVHSFIFCEERHIIIYAIRTYLYSIWTYANESLVKAELKYAKGLATSAFGANGWAIYEHIYCLLYVYVIYTKPQTNHKRIVYTQ